MPQQLVINIGGTVEGYFLGSQVASCNAAVYNADGGEVVASTAATVDSVNTTLSSQAAAEATSVSVASATGIVAGRRYLVGGVVAETVTVKDVSGTTITLYAPLMNRHASGQAFQGTRVSLAVAAASVPTLFWGGYCVFTPVSGEPVEEVVEVVRRKIAVNLIDMSDVRGIFPQADKMLEGQLDIPMALRDARDNFVRDLDGKFRAHTMLGTEHFRRPCALRFWLDRRHSMGSDWQANMDGVETEYGHWLDKLASTIPVDGDQDGATNGPNDGGIVSIRLERM